MLGRKEVEDSFEAVPAYIVADKRDRLGRRLGRLAFTMLILFFVASSYVQAASNGRELERANKQRGQLVDSQERISRSLEGQGALIVQLQATISRQNEALRLAGLPVEPVPTLEEIIANIQNGTLPNPSGVSSADPNSSGQGDGPRNDSPPARNNDREDDEEEQEPNNPPPSPQPSNPPPSDPPGPADPVTDLICMLTGVCV